MTASTVFPLRYEDNSSCLHEWEGGRDSDFQSFPRLESPYSSILVFFLLVVIQLMIEETHQI